VAVDAQAAVGPTCFVDCPSVAIDACDTRPRAGIQRPAGPGCAGAATDVEQGGRRSRLQRGDDMADADRMQGAVEQRERGALAGAVERGAGVYFVAALDVSGR
jgi:hypothetical protein